MSMQNIAVSDLVRDEYGNYYVVLGIHKEEDSLKAIEVSNLYFEKSFEVTSLGEANSGKPIGAYLQDQLIDYIEEVKRKERPIYAIRDLMVNRIAVYAVDITQPHPKAVEGQS